MFMVISYKILSGTYKHTIIVLEGGIILTGGECCFQGDQLLTGEDYFIINVFPNQTSNFTGVREKENCHNFFLIKHDVRHK